MEHVFKIMKEIYFQSVILYPTKLSLKFKIIIKTFTMIQELKKFTCRSFTHSQEVTHKND